MLRLCDITDTFADMMTDALTTHEQPMTLAAAARLFPTKNGKSVSLVSMRRWVATGVRGVRLGASYSGGRWWTTRDAVERFTAEVTRRRLAAATVAPQRTARATDDYLRTRYGI